MADLKWRVLGVAAFAMLSCVTALAAGKGPTFPMGVWFEGGVGALRDGLIPADPVQAAPIYRKQFRDMAAHGVNAAVVPNTPPEHHQALLDAAQAAGVKLIIEVAPSGGELGDMIRGGKPLTSDAVRTCLARDLGAASRHPALWRLQLLDEPPAGTFGRYAEVAKELHAYASDIKPFTCLIGSDSFDDFLSSTRSDVAAFDCYTISVNTPLGDRNALRSFEAVATKAGLAAARHNAASWAVMQVHAITGVHRFPTPGEIRCLTYLSLATGSKGLWWFLYQTEYWNKAKGEVMSGLIDMDGRSDARWDEIARLTKEVRTLAPTLLNLQPVQTKPDDRPDASTHMLRDRKGRTYLFTVNLDTTAARSVETVATVSGNHTVIRLPGGKRVPARKTTQGLAWTERVPAGSGALYRID